MSVKDDMTSAVGRAVTEAGRAVKEAGRAVKEAGRAVTDSGRYPVYDEFVIEADDHDGEIHYLTVRECRDCGVVVGNKQKHDAYHEFLSEICFREASRS